ncbi:MAG TPA: hypothetical protein VL463_05330 [Kofleriaceae bacterium]|nr:hypothetical protein [Kofleriaceae bacterium]
MKFTKHMVLIGGVCAVIAFFLPYVGLSAGDQSAKVSAFDVVKGYQAMPGWSQTVGYVFLVFGPPMLLLVQGAVALKTGKFGRLAGVGSLILGGWGALMGAALISVINDKHDEILTAEVGAGTYIFLVAGILGAVGGLLALIKPDRGSF